MKVMMQYSINWVCGLNYGPQVNLHLHCEKCGRYLNGICTDIHFDTESFMFNLVSTKTFRSFSAKLLSTEEATIIYWCMGVLLPRCRTSQFPLLNLLTFLLTHFSSLLRSFWMTAWPSSVSATSPSLVSPGHLLRLHSAPSSRGLTGLHPVLVTEELC